MLPIQFTNPRASLLSWDPFRELNRVGRWLNSQDDEPIALGFPVDVRETDNSYIVEANLPGWSKDDVQVTLEDSVLTISAEKTESNATPRPNGRPPRRRAAR